MILKKNERVWQRMLSGRKLDILSPSPIDIEIKDIALGLSRVARWNGQTVGEYSYSVAQHSLLVEKIFTQNFRNFTKDWRLAALLHDAPEYVIGDLITPFKYALNNGYRLVEKKIMEAIYSRYGLPSQLPSIVENAIKTADKAAAWIEAVQIAGYNEDQALQIMIKPELSLNFEIKNETPKLSNKKFLLKFNQLYIKNK